MLYRKLTCTNSYYVRHRTHCTDERQNNIRTSSRLQFIVSVFLFSLPEILQTSFTVTIYFCFVLEINFYL